MNLFTATPAEFCALTKACGEGRDWAITQPTMSDVWDHCPRSDWLLWILNRLGQRPDDRTLRLFAIWCARHTPIGDGRVTGDLLTDPRSIAALEIAERYAAGGATAEELVAAHDAAHDAAYAAAYAAVDAAAYAAYDAAYAAAYAAQNAAAYACFASAASAARVVSAAYAARVVSAAYAATAAKRAQADQLRRMVANPFRPEGGAT
jgi:hypothetical protein